MQDSLIAKRARQFEWATIALLLIMLIAVPIALADGTLSVDKLREEYDITNFPEIPSGWAVNLWRVIELGGYTLICYVVWCVRGWLAACANGDTFQADTARRVLRIGQGLLLIAILNIVSHTIIVLAVTWNNPAGERTLSIAIDGSGLFTLLAAALLTLFGYIQSEAARVMAENREFI